MIRVIAEAGQCMGGSIKTAVEMARQAKLAGAWGFKVQLLKPETIAQTAAPKYWVDTLGTTNQREAFTRAGLIDYGDWIAVKMACDRIGIEFLATPFDLDAVDMLEQIGVRYYKIASGDLTYTRLLHKVGDTGKPVLLSTGAAYLHEIQNACVALRHTTVILLACTLAYPTSADAAHLGRIDRLHRDFPGHAVGYSDHTSLPESAMCAAALGAEYLEVHYTLDNDGPDVPDHRMAVNPQRLAEYVDAAERGVLLRGDPTLAPVPEELAARDGARRSVCAARNLPVGHILAVEDLICLRPGDGFPAHLEDRFVGKAVTRPMREGELL